MIDFAEQILIIDFLKDKCICFDSSVLKINPSHTPADEPPSLPPSQQQKKITATKPKKINKPFFYYIVSIATVGKKLNILERGD